MHDDQIWLHRDGLFDNVHQTETIDGDHSNIDNLESLVRVLLVEQNL